MMFSWSEAAGVPPSTLGRSRPTVLDIGRPADLRLVVPAVRQTRPEVVVTLVISGTMPRVQVRQILLSVPDSGTDSNIWRKADILPETSPDQPGHLADHRTSCRYSRRSR